MIAKLVTGSPILWLPAVSLILFIAFFAAVVVRLARRGAAAYDREAHLPLEDDHG
jgi:hypothetical protein